VGQLFRNGWVKNSGIGHRLGESLALAGESLKGEIIRRVIHEVEVLPESIRVWYKVEGQEILPYLEAEDGAEAAAADGSQKAKKYPAFSQVFLKNRGSTTLQNGVARGKWGGKLFTSFRNW